MSRLTGIELLLILFSFGTILNVPGAQAQGRIRSDHVWIKVPAEREWLGRETITELEGCWRYVSRVTDGKLPRMVVVEVDWDGIHSSAVFENSSITIGMGHPSARRDLKRYLLHNSAREMVLLGLDQLTRGATRKQENRSLAEGMAEILAHEYDLSTKALTAAWTISHLLSRIDGITLASLSSQPGGASHSRGLGASSPAITFLLFCREQYGREKTLKLIEALRKGGLRDAIGSTLRASPTAVEETWLERLRRVEPPAELTVTSQEDSPSLSRTEFVPPIARRGEKMTVLLHIMDAGNNLDPRFVFLVEDSGAVHRGRAAGSTDNPVRIEIPIGLDRPEGSHGFKVVAVDSSGNLRSWDGKYRVGVSEDSPTPP